MVLLPQYIIMIMKQQQHIEFLNWLRNRLAFKYHDNDANLHNQLDEITEALRLKDFVIDKKKIMKICKKLYPMFNLEKDEKSLFDIGYSKKEKIDILNHVTSVISEYHVQ